MHVLRRLLQAVDDGDTCVLATVVEVVGSAPRKAGTRLLVSARGLRVGTVGGGEVEAAALASAAEMLAGPGQARTLAIPTNCGGVATLLLETFAPSRRLLVVGAGHVGTALARAGARSGYRVTLAAPEKPAQPEGAPPVECVAAPDPALLDTWDGAERTHLIVATGDAGADGRWAIAALARPFAGIGVIGSHNKAEAIRRAAAAAGVAPERIAALRCPVGLDLGAVTPEEIAVAIVAELIRLDRVGEVPEPWRRASRG